MDETLFQSWIWDLRKEIQGFGTTQINDLAKVFVMYKIGQNVLSLGAGIKEDPGGKISCNLMVYEPAKDQLRVILTHGFYYKNVFHRLFPLKPRDGKDRRGSCGIAFQKGEIKWIDNAQFDQEVLWEKHIKVDQENMGSVINIPLEKFGVLNVDSRTPNWFVPHEKYKQRVQEVQKVATDYMQFYTIANPFLEQYRPSSLRAAHASSVPQGLVEDMAMVERCLILGVPEAAIFACRRGVEKISISLGIKPTPERTLAMVLKELQDSGRLDSTTFTKLKKINQKANKVIHSDPNARASRQDADNTFQLLQEAAEAIFVTHSSHS
jgi:hypothetical protein